MENIKKDILKSFIPRAVLLPLNSKAKKSLVNEKIISIKNLPYKVGRESRLGKNERGFFIKLRIFSDESKANNDIYLIDEDEFLQISKEHFEISLNEDNHYILRDRGSSNGTTLNGNTIGGERQVSEDILKDGDIIQIGSESSEYRFQFLTLEI